MKKLLPVLLALLLLTLLAACGTPTSTTPLTSQSQTETPTPTPTQTEAATTSFVVFADPALEEMLCSVMGKPIGEITVEDAKP